MAAALQEHRTVDDAGARHAHASYTALAGDGEVDAIYIGTPHNCHRENTLLCLDSGKAVLCEKPFAVNTAEAREMVERARSRGVFLMEAMWTHFFPAMVKLRELLGQGAIGEVLGNGYTYEAIAVMEDLRAGRIENEVMPHVKTLGVMRTLDRLRAAWGLEYPGETN